MKEQIDEMTKTILETDILCHTCGVSTDSYCAEAIAKALYSAGYRKQKEGEWIEHIENPSWLEDDVEVYYNCSVCGTSHWSFTMPFCPNCGAKMKGGAE